MKNRKVLITGANGFVGSALCRDFSYQDTTVIAIVRNEESDISQISHLKNVRIIICDQENINHLSEMVTDRDIDVFFHFAWNGTSGNLRGDAYVQTENIKNTCNSVKCCSDLGCKRFVYASSIMEYEIIKIASDYLFPGINTLYSSAKLAADYMARSISGQLGIEYVTGIISNIYGPGEKSPRLINTSLRKMLNGEHCSFSSGKQTYDFIYLDDAVKAFSAIGSSGKNGVSYYIGSTNPRPLKEFLLEMRDCVNPSISIGIGELPSPTSTLSYNEFDIKALERDTGFIPSISFSEGIKRTVDWLKTEDK